MLEKNNKMSKFYMIFARKIFFQIVFLGGQLPPLPVSYAYVAVGRVHVFMYIRIRDARIIEFWVRIRPWILI